MRQELLQVGRDFVKAAWPRAFPESPAAEQRTPAAGVVAAAATALPHSRLLQIQSSAANDTSNSSNASNSSNVTVNVTVTVTSLNASNSSDEPTEEDASSTSEE